MAIDKVRPLKLEDPASGGTETDDFPTSLDPSEDHVQCAGVVLEDATHSDETTRIWRDGVDMRFSDGSNPTSLTLTQLIGGSAFDPNKQIMETSGLLVYVGDGDIVMKE